MNIFYLANTPEISAEYHCDTHVVKMILETAQLLSSAYIELDGKDVAIKKGLYISIAFKNHPCAKWTRKSDGNYQWLHRLLRALCYEYTIRYGKVHKTELIGMVKVLSTSPNNINKGSKTTIPQCMPDKYKSRHPVTAYRNYYIGEKLNIAKWNYTKVPYWVEDMVDINKVA